MKYKGNKLNTAKKTPLKQYISVGINLILITRACVTFESYTKNHILARAFIFKCLEQNL